jgi:hypothetical protein
MIRPRVWTTGDICWFVATEKGAGIGYCSKKGSSGLLETRNETETPARQIFGQAKGHSKNLRLVPPGTSAL